jgi:hypothetical protein
VSGDHIRQRLEKALDEHWRATFTGENGHRWKTADAYRQGLAAALEQTVRDLIADALDAQQDYADSYEGDGLIRPADIRADAAALRARTEETTT